MNELTKTCIYIGIAVVAGALAVFTRPDLESELKLDDMVGKTLFEGFTDTDKATNLEVIRFDDELSQIDSFRVEKDTATGAWTIPSHAGYPADAENQMRDSAAVFVGLDVLDVQDPQSESAQADFGVVEPDKSKLKPGDKGVGIQTIIRDDKGAELVNLIIGNAVEEDDDGTGEDQKRYVRIPGQSPIYTVKLDPSKLTTDFEDWIKKDLLDLASFDIEEVEIKDYAYRVTGSRTVTSQPRSNIVVSWDSTDSKWELDELVSFTPDGKPVKSSLLDGEEPNKEKLNELKNALDDLEIVDVRRKPEGLGADLSAGQSLSAESFQSLVGKGFYPLAEGLKGANGEINVGTKDGVTYYLTFGNLVNQGESNRYLFVTAQVDESKFPQPELMDLPPKPTGLGEPPAKEPEGDGKEPPAGSAADSAEQPSDAGEKVDGDEAPKGDETGDGCQVDLAPQEGEESGQSEVDAPTSDSESANGQESKDAASDVPNGDGQNSSQDPPPAGADEAGVEDAEKPADDQDVRQAEWEAERERITKENQKKIDERDEKYKKAQEKIRQLNGKFAPWYYVISEDVYKKIHLNRGDVVVEGKDAKKTGFDVDSLRELEDNGLKKDDGSDGDDTP